MKNLIFVLVGVCVILFSGYFAFTKGSSNLPGNLIQHINSDLGQILPRNNQPLSSQVLSPCQDYLSPDCKTQLAFAVFNSNLELDKNGNNFVAVFNPKSLGLDFKVNLGLKHSLYQKKAGKIMKDYQPKTFAELISEQNALLDQNKPFLAINADYIDVDNKPQGYNVSRGVEYSGVFADKRSSFAISKNGQPSIQIGSRKGDFGFNAVGGNGRFIENGVYQDICDKLGQSACFQETARSMAIITDLGWVVFFVHRPVVGRQLLPKDFEFFLTEMTNFFKVGKAVDGLLFDGGASPALMYDNVIYQQGQKPIGSVFMLYLKNKN